ncbi:MAG: 1-acyl-sn-glycerol-3-phosphate acyltransferase [Allomuricauda sp.]
MGRENIPLEKPVLFLSNHQNALMDVMLLATRCHRKPWFLTRSDVFRNGFLKSVFSFLQMLPIYRIRDGRANLHKNRGVFEQCGQLLKAGEAILVFPEANHSLRRRVRPLSKGFTRIIHAALEHNPDLDLQLVPVGQNYAHPRQVGDSAAIHFGKPIAVQQYLNSPNFAANIMDEVRESLKRLTAHIPEEGYGAVTQKLGEEGEIYLQPERVNSMIAETGVETIPAQRSNPAHKINRVLFALWNLPLVVLWRLLLKPKVPEPEFEATFRFGFVLVAYPFFYGLCGLILWNMYDIKTACLFILGHAVFNVFLVKLGITSAVQRK